MQIVPRAAIGVPDPGTRSLLAPKIIPLLVHYTGVNGFTDPAKDDAYAKSVAAYGASASSGGKTWEYNYLIGLGGTVYEQAGPCRGAHCLNFNDKSYGVLFMNGIGVAPSDAQIASFHDLRDYLVSTGQLHTAHAPVPHYRYRSTSCPGLVLAEKAGAYWASPTGEGALGNVIPELITRTVVAPAPTVPTDRPSVGVGSNGPLVSGIQIILNERANQGLVVDGSFGPVTARAWNNVCLFVNNGAAAPWPVDSEVSGRDWDLLAYLDKGWDRLLFCGFPKAAI